MGKRNLVLYVDDNLIEIAKGRGWNLSELFNNMLQGMVNTKEDDKVSIDDLNKKELKLQNELNKIKALRLAEEHKKDKQMVFEIEN